MKSLFFAFTTIVIASTQYGYSSNIDYCAISGKAQSATIEEVRNRYKLRCIGSGGGAMDVVRTADFMLQADREITIPEARRILVCSMLIYADQVNSCRPLRPFLIQFPFPMHNLGVSLLCNNSIRVPFKNKNYFSFADVVIGKIIYYENCPPKDNMRELFRESFEEALKIVEKDDPEFLKEIPKRTVLSSIPKLLLSDLKSSVFNEPEARGDFLNEKYSGPPECRKRSWDLDDYGEAIAKKCGMVFNRAGNPTEVDYRTVLYGLDLFDTHTKTLEEGKLVAATILRDFLAHLQASSAVAEYHKYMMGKLKKHVDKPPTTERPDPSQMCLKIGYWDENFDRPQAPYLAQILFVEGFCNYYVAEPDTQALKLVFRESYDEAMKRLVVTDGKELKGT